MRSVRRFQLLLVLMALCVGCTEEGDSTAQSDQKTAAVRLHEAAWKGDIEAIQSLIAGGCDVDAPDEKERTPLYTATEHGQIQVVELLISRGANVNAKDADGLGALRAALNDGRHLDIAKLLIEAGADTRGTLYNAAWWEPKEVMEFLLANGAEITPGNTKENETLLLFSVQHDMRDFVEKLLAGGANPNAVDRGRTGLSALTTAVQNGYKEIATLLIAHGADVNKPDYTHMTPLCYAMSANKDVVELLLTHGADMNRCMALHWAVARGDKAIVELLLKHGADVNVKDGNGETPLDEAIARGNGNIIDLLQEHGATTGQGQDAEDTP